MVPGAGNRSRDGDGDGDGRCPDPSKRRPQESRSKDATECVAGRGRSNVGAFPPVDFVERWQSRQIHSRTIQGRLATHRTLHWCLGGAWDDEILENMTRLDHVATDTNKP